MTSRPPKAEVGIRLLVLLLNVYALSSMGYVVTHLNLSFANDGMSLAVPITAMSTTGIVAFFNLVFLGLCLASVKAPRAVSISIDSILVIPAYITNLGVFGYFTRYGGFPDENSNSCLTRHVKDQEECVRHIGLYRDLVITMAAVTVVAVILTFFDCISSIRRTDRKARGLKGDDKA